MPSKTIAPNGARTSSVNSTELKPMTYAPRTFRHATIPIIVRQANQNCKEVIWGNQNLRYSANMTGYSALSAKLHSQLHHPSWNPQNRPNARSTRDAKKGDPDERGEAEPARGSESHGLCALGHTSGSRHSLILRGAPEGVKHESLESPARTSSLVKFSWTDYPRGEGKDHATPTIWV